MFVVWLIELPASFILMSILSFLIAVMLIGAGLTSLGYRFKDEIEKWWRNR